MDPELRAALDAYRTELMGSVAPVAGDVKKLLERMDEFEKKANRPGAPGDRDEGDEKSFALERKALACFARGGVAAVQRDAETKAMQVGSDADGGFLVVSARSPTMIKKLHDVSPLRRLARIETISTDAIEIPVDTDEVGATWVGETEARPETSTAQVGVQRIPVHETYSNPKVTQQLLDDASVDLGAWLEGKISEKFGRQESLAFISGTGIKQPRGFLTYPVATTTDAAGRPRGTLQYLPSGHATLITPDALLNLVWGLRAPHRSGAAWLMNSATAATIMKFKDGQGNYIWSQSLVAGAPSVLLGYKVEIDENMPDIGAGALPVAFANWQAYLIVDRIGMRVIRDNLTAKPFVAFYSTKRVGGDVTDFDAIKLLKVEA